MPVYHLHSRGNKKESIKQELFYSPLSRFLLLIARRLNYTDHREKTNITSPLQDKAANTNFLKYRKQNCRSQNRCLLIPSC